MYIFYKQQKKVFLKQLLVHVSLIFSNKFYDVPNLKYADFIKSYMMTDYAYGLAQK